MRPATGMHRRSILLFLTLLFGFGPVRAQIDPHPHEHTGPVCGTIAWMAEEAGIRDPKRPSIHSIACEFRAPKQRSHLTEGNHFRIHFDVSGRDSVSVVDRGGNGVPDYIDSMEVFLEGSLALETIEYGFDAPPPDNRGMGPEIDVYVCDLSGAYYGVAMPERDIPTGPNTVMGFLIVDNDFSPEQEYPTPGIPGLKVTCAHELHHIIQFSRYRFDFSQAALYEATSVWFEREYAPEVNDYLQYVQPFLQAPQAVGFSTHNVSEIGAVTGYAHVLYLDYLEKRLDRDIVRRIWERFKSEPICFNAIDLALRDSMLNLENSYCEFAEWCYHTGARADERYFDEARIYKTMLPAQVREFNGDDLLIQDLLYPLSFGLYRVLAQDQGSSTQDTIDFVVTNARTNFGTGRPNIPRDTFVLECVRSPRDGFKPLPHGNDTIYFRLRSSNTQYCVNPLFGGRAITFPATRIAPQPFISDGAARVIFGVGMAPEQVQSAKLWIYSSSLTRVRFVEQTELLPQDNQLGVIWDGRDSHGDLVPTGIYIFELSINDDTPILGKVAVVRR
jgi:hypothetical protein